MSAKTMLNFGEGERLSSVLVVDAEPQVREAVSEILNVKSHYLFFEDSPDQIERVFVEKSPIAAALIDVFRPVERFFELIAFVKYYSPKTQVICISWLADVDLWIEFLQRGAYDYLAKPLDRKELRRIVTNALERHRSA